MKQETKQCKNCKSEFAIEPEDFAFYEKIKVPPPTFCPECRMIRRMTWRNERSLYKRKCDVTGKDIITMFAPSSPFVVYEKKEWWSDKWNPLDYGLIYNFDQPFFLQFRKLLEKVPMPSVFVTQSTDSEFSNHIGEFKSAYLVFASWIGENISYAAKVINCRDSFDLLGTEDNELCYENVNSNKMYKVFFAENSVNCNNSLFLYDCRGCSHCFGCTGLRNKSYYIFNQEYSKYDYQNKIKEFDVGSYMLLGQVKKKFLEIKLNAIRKFAQISNSQNSTGDNLSHVFNCKFCFDLKDDARDCKYAINGGMKMNDCYDAYGCGANAELLYEILDTGAKGSKFLFDIVVHGGNNVLYSYNCHSCHDCFACIGLRNKQYCILNKQYTKESFDKLRTKIIDHMNEMPYTDKKGRIYKYGEFFPPELSPFAYNETIAQEYFPLTKKQAIDKGCTWKDQEKRDYQITKKSVDLPDNIKDVDDSILNEIIGCEHEGECNEQCTEAFKIIKPELEFYRKMNLPLPRLCPNCRHYQRLKQRNPMKLWHRKCQCTGYTSGNGIYTNTGLSHSPHKDDEHCPNEFETSYAPERKEIVYCEKCYQNEVV